MEFPTKFIAILVFGKKIFFMLLLWITNHEFLTLKTVYIYTIIIKLLWSIIIKALIHKYVYLWINALIIIVIITVELSGLKEIIYFIVLYSIFDFKVTECQHDNLKSFNICWRHVI